MCVTVKDRVKSHLKEAGGFGNVDQIPLGKDRQWWQEFLLNKTKILTISFLERTLPQAISQFEVENMEYLESH